MVEARSNGPGAPGVLPVRSAGDEHAGRIRLTLGSKKWEVPVLSIRANRAWKESLSSHLGSVFAGISASTDVSVLFSLVGTATDVQLDLIEAYDTGKALPGRDWIEDNATEPELYAALKEVLSAAFPMGAEAVSRLPGLIGLVTSEMARDRLSTPTSLPPQPTAGPTAKSKKS